MPYRVDLADQDAGALERLIELGALDVDSTPDGGSAALMPDSVTTAQVAAALGIDEIAISPAVGRDAESVWVLRPRPVRIGLIELVPAGTGGHPDALQLIDAPAFGTGLHPTTALCLEALQDALEIGAPDAILDVGTGSGVLALSALMLGVPKAVAIDIDDAALRAAADNARINGLDGRLQLARGGPAAMTGQWPLVLANVLAAPLIEMAPALVPRVGRQGRLVLSGIPWSVEKEVDRAYRHLGLQRVEVKSRGGWIALVMQTPW